MLASTVRNCSLFGDSNKLSFLLQPEFYQVCHTKAEYEEHGPQICRFVHKFKQKTSQMNSSNSNFRYNAVFGCMT